MIGIYFLYDIGLFLVILLGLSDIGEFYIINIIFGDINLCFI